MNSTTDWQTWAAIAVVVITTLIFAMKSAGRKSGGCGSCGCGHSHNKKPAEDKTERRR